MKFSFLSKVPWLADFFAEAGSESPVEASYEKVEPTFNLCTCLTRVVDPETRKCACGGYEKAPRGCTCTCYRDSNGVKLNLVKYPNSACTATH
jgi:hypothetical protein